MSALVRIRRAIADERLRAAEMMHMSEARFLPAALEVVEQPVSPTVRMTARLMLAGLALLLLWLMLGRIDVVASAPGRVVPAAGVKLVQPRDGGVVRAILVRDGQHVRKGQPLVILDPTTTAAEVEQARAAMLSSALDAARAKAVLGGLDGRGFAFAAPAGAAPAIAATHRQLAAAQLQQIRAGMAMQGAGSRAAAAATAEARGQAAKLGETIPLLKEQLEANEKLLAKGFVSKLRVIEMRRQYLVAMRDRDIAERSVAGAGAQYASATSGAIQSGAEARAEILSALARAQSDVAMRREELVKTLRRASYNRILAPVDGIVAQLAIHTEGGVIEPASPIMAIVPDGGRLVVEARLLNRDIGFVSVGQSVAIKLEAFPFTRFGTIPGRVLSIGSDAVIDEKLGPVYVIRIALAPTTVDRGDRLVPILPGMVAEADIRTGRRSFMSYLLSPIAQAGREAGHER